MGEAASGQGEERPALSRLEWLCGVPFFALIAWLAASPIACTDFFWHLRLGKETLSRHGIVRTDLFSAVHPDAPYVQPQWLWEVLAASVDNASGLTGIRIMQAAVMVASFALLLWLLRGISKTRELAWCIASIALFLFVDRFRARPDSMTLLFVAASLPILLSTRDDSVRVLSRYAFLLALFWANMHGGAALLLVLSLLALLVGSVLELRFAGAPRERVRNTLSIFGWVLFGLALSPTLLPGLIHWFSLIGKQLETGNEEWLPTFTLLEKPTLVTALIVALPCVILLVYISEQVLWIKRGGHALSRASEWFLSAGYLLLSMQAVRNVFLCFVPLVFFAQRTSLPGKTRAFPAILGAFLVLLAAHDVIDVAQGGPGHALALMHDDLRPDTYPVEASDFLADAGIEGGIFNEGKWGGYLIERTFPRCHVFVDTRQNLTPEMWQVFLATLSAAQRTQALEFAFTRWGVELAVFRAPTFALLRPPPSFVLLYRSGDQEVYQHLGGAHAQQNLARTRRYFAQHGKAAQPFEQAAVQLGATRWLAAPEQVRTLHEAQSAIRSGDRTQQRQGHEALGELNYRAGLYADAEQAFLRADALSPLAARSLYFAAFSAFAADDRDTARKLLARLSHRDTTQLSRRQLERLALLDAALKNP